MTIPIERVVEISREVIRESRPEVKMLGVLPTDGGSPRIEILVTIAGCHQEPCRLLINLTRTDADEFEQELRDKLHDALQAHAAGRRGVQDRPPS